MIIAPQGILNSRPAWYREQDCLRLGGGGGGEEGAEDKDKEEMLLES